jgi:hypothetical protein
MMAGSESLLDPAPLGGEQLADLLMRLLLDSALRDRLGSEGAAAVAANAGELDCLETVDVDELDNAARRFRSTIWRLGRGGDLGAAFSLSTRMLTSAGVTESELLTGFLGSEHFGRFKLVPYSGPGLSVEESFAGFLLDFAEVARARLAAGGLAQADALILRQTIAHELMMALFTALACEQPLSFVIATDQIIRTDRGHAALRWYSPTTLAAWDTDDGRTEPADARPARVPYAYFGTPAGVARGVVSQEVVAAFEPAATAAGDAARRALAKRGLW